jgi:hypothetical protein
MTMIVLPLALGLSCLSSGFLDLFRSPPKKPESSIDSTQATTRPTPIPRLDSTAAIPPVVPEAPTPTVRPLQLASSPAFASHPFVQIVLPDLKVEQVKSKITPRLMNRGWMLTQNRNDSVDFNIQADSTLVTGLFQTPYQPQSRVVLRFGLRNSREGVITKLQAMLISPDERNQLVRNLAIADTSVLRQNLEAIQAEEFGPGMLIPTREGPKKKKKK